MAANFDDSGSGRISRRSFIERTSVLAAGTAVAGTLVVPKAVHANTSDELKVALIGSGKRGAGAAAQALHTGGNVKLWAMADAFEDRLESTYHILNGGDSVSQGSAAGLQSQIDVPPERRFVGLDAYKHAIDSGVDVVILAEPPGFRPQHLEYAVDAGKHIFMEKPLATDAPGVRRVLAAAEDAKKKNLKVGVGLQRHHQESYLQCLKQLHDGAIGDIRVLRCYWDTGFPAKTPFPRGDLSELAYQVRNWYFFCWLSGDHICEQHIHNLDVCNWIKQSHPVEAHGSGGRQVRTGIEYGNIFDHHDVEFTYADGSKMMSQCRQIPGCRRFVGEEAHGTKGNVSFTGRTAEIERFDGDGWKYRRPRSGQPQTSPYQTEHDVLFDAIVNDKPHNEAEYGALSTMTAILGRLATYSGKLVTWEEAFNSDVELTIDATSWDDHPRSLPNEQGAYAIPVPGISEVL